MARPALAATRALEIISYLTEHADEAFTMAQLTRALKLNQGSAHAILSTLVDGGFLVRHRVHKTYRLGPAFVSVGEAAAIANPVIGVARDELSRLAKELGLEALASMRTAAELRVVVRVGRHATSGPARRVGQRYPLVPPLGAALVAWSPSDVRDAWVSAGVDYGASVDDLEALLDHVREAGCHVGSGAQARGDLGVAAEELASAPHDQERAARVLEQAKRVGFATGATATDGDVAAVAAPVLDADGYAVLECVVHGFRAPLTAEELSRIASALRDACTVISRRTWHDQGGA